MSSTTKGTAMDVFEGILRVKRIREDSRENDLRHCRRELDRATQALREAQEHQQSADAARQKREQDMYADVMSRLVVVADLDDLHTEMDRLKEESTQDAKTVEAAHEQREKRRTAVGEATQAWRGATQVREKFDALLHDQRLLRRQEDERAAELELEDYPLRGRDAAQLLEA
jgi:type III secretion protein O